jgi:hypothetical protein
LSRGSDTLEKPFKIMSFRQAVKIEHPGGIPLAQNLQDYGLAWDGNLLLAYEPPVVIKNTISVGVVVRINKTTVSFSGTLETEFAGDTFSPSEDLIASVQRAVKQMAEDIGEKNNATIGVVIEELLDYCTVNVPVKQIYEKIRVEYPAEYRAMNLEYKRRTGSSIEEAVPELVSQQQGYRFGKLTSFTKTAFQKKELVTINQERLEDLKKANPKLHAKIVEQLEQIKPINGKYIVFDTAKDDTIFLVGKNPKSATGLSKTDLAVPKAIFDAFEEEKEDDLEWMSAEDKKFFGVESPEDKQKQKESLQKQRNTQKEIVQKLGIPNEAFADLDTAINYYPQLIRLREELQKQNIPTARKVDVILKKVETAQKESLERDFEWKKIPMEALQNPQVANQYKKQILELANLYASKNHHPLNIFTKLVQSLKNTPPSTKN